MKNNATDTHALKLRWSGLLLAALVAFVLLANARPPAPDRPASQVVNQPALSARPAANTADEEAEIVAFADPGHSERTEMIAAPPPENPPPIEHTDESKAVQTIIVRNGDTLSGIFDRLHVYSSLGKLLTLKSAIDPLRRLKPGAPMHLQIEGDTLVSLVYELSPTKHLEIKRRNGKYTVTERTLPIEKREAYAFGGITGSFYQAGLDAGLSDRIIIDMANVLGWDIDFALDVRRGDLFSVIYEEEYLYGEKLRDGDILAIEFINNGKTYRAVRYTGADGRPDYFSPDGRTMRKPFLRNPIEYVRISSHFNPRRLHPIFKIVRPHRGVDYAAPTGTPVRAAGDGRVAFLGSKPGYGNVVIIRHGRIYSTLYAHLSKFARGVRRGSRIRQKQTIGYVGMTGYATGPHLHYEFRVNGAHKNPLTVRLPKSEILPKKERARFKRSISPSLAKLDTLKRAYASIASE